LNTSAAKQLNLDAIADQLGVLQGSLKSRRLFLTGGTGFFGRWILETIAHLNACHDLNLSVVVLTRDADRFRSAVPSLARAKGIRFIQGDVVSFEFPSGKFDYVIHAATPVVAQSSSLELWNTITEGTRRVLDFSKEAGVERFLLTSSGAIYGAQPPDLPFLPETYNGAPDTLVPTSTYGQGKRAAEHLCSSYSFQYQLCCTVARCFAFVGPHLPLDAHFAIGNFIRDAMAGLPLQISGDGTPLRSYLYGSDLVVWLFTILLKGRTMTAYNVGSDKPISILELAELVRREINPQCEIRLGRTEVAGNPRQSYVPSIDRAKKDLGLEVTISLSDAVRMTSVWHKEIKK